MKRLILTITIALLSLPAAASAHTRSGSYAEMAWAPRDYQSPYELVGGLPIVDYGTVKARNPVTTAQFGLTNYSLWSRYHEPYRWTNAVKAGEWLLGQQGADGMWHYKFKFVSVPGAEGGTLYPGWTSALAQGQIMSLFGRLYRHTHDARYLRAIKRAIRPLHVHVRDGGLARWHNGGVYFEEYPTRTRMPNFILNGMEMTLLGLYDVEDLVPDARDLLDRGASTLARTLPEFDLPGTGIAAASLAVHSKPSPEYFPIVRDDLRILARITGRRTFSKWADRWST